MCEQSSDILASLLFPMVLMKSCFKKGKEERRKTGVDAVIEV